jgi:Flp pilus assembly protein TadD
LSGVYATEWFYPANSVSSQARASEQKGQMPLAIQAFRKGLELEGNTQLWAGLAHALAVCGKSAEARQVLDQLHELAKQRYAAPYNFAETYLGLGDIDSAFASSLCKASSA